MNPQWVQVWAVKMYPKYYEIFTVLSFKNYQESKKKSIHAKLFWFHSNTKLFQDHKKQVQLSELQQLYLNVHSRLQNTTIEQILTNQLVK